MDEAFKRTGVPREKFRPTEWAKYLNGKSGVVEWVVDGIAEISVDAPHLINGPDVFHVGYKVYDSKKEQKTVGHILVDCVPYFRKIKK